MIDPDRIELVQLTFKPTIKENPKTKLHKPSSLNRPLSSKCFSSCPSLTTLLLSLFFDSLDQTQALKKLSPKLSTRASPFDPNFQSFPCSYSIDT